MILEAENSAMTTDISDLRLISQIHLKSQQISFETGVAMEFATTLEELIGQHGLTTAKLAKRSDVSPKTISEQLTGRTPRDLDAVKRCAEVFDISVHYLLYGENDPHNIITDILEKTEVHSGEELSHKSSMSHFLDNDCGLFSSVFPCLTGSKS